MNRRTFLAAVVAASLPAWAAKKKGKKKGPDRAAEWEKLSAEDQERVRARWKTFKEWPPAEQAKRREALKRFEKFSEDKQKRLRNGQVRWDSLNDEQKERLRAQFAEFKALNPAERKVKRNLLLRGRDEEQGN